MGKRPKPLIERFPRRRRRQLIERQFKSIIFTSTTYITRIEAKIHRIIITGNIDVTEIDKFIGPLTKNLDYYHSENKTYNKMSDGTWNEIDFQVFTEPLKPFKQKIKIQITPPEGISARKFKSLLTAISGIFNTFKITSIEYAVDIYQPDRVLVGILFWVLKKYVLIRRQLK